MPPAWWLPFEWHNNYWDEVRGLEKASRSGLQSVVNPDTDSLEDSHE